MAGLSFSGVFWLGYTEFRGIGGYQEHFISELLENGIKMRCVRSENGIITGRISPLDYLRAAETARQCGVRLRAGKRHGLYFSLQKYSRRVGLYVGFMLFCLILAVGQSMVADIRITGDAPKAQIIDILEQCGITRGAPVYDLDLSLAERKIMLEVENVAWVDVSCVGCRVNVDVEGGIPKPEMLDVNQPCNIVSSRDAVIVDTVVRKGQLIAQPGSGVSKGEILVSGIIANGGDELLYRHANAEIIGEFYESREFFVPYSETIKLADGEQVQYRYLAFCDDIYPLFVGEAYQEDSLYTQQTEKLSLFGNETPFSLITGTFTKYRDVPITRSDDDCLRELKKQREAFEENFYSECEIVAAIEKCLPEKEGIRLIVDYTLRGDIAQEQPIEVSYDAAYEQSETDD